MKRGEIYAMVGKGDFSGKPRPSLIVQSDLFNGFHPAVTACPITSTQTGDYLFRVPVLANEQTGLDCDSEIQVDKVQAVKAVRVRQRIGVVSDEVMLRVDDALRLWLDL